MAVKLRLQRTGRRNYAQWRLVATDSRSARDAKCIETLGWYDPHREGKSEEVKVDRYEYWLSVGAQPSATVRQIIARIKRTAGTPAQT